MFIRRFTQLQIGLLLYGASLSLMVRADLGLNPWSVLHQGLSELTGLSLGLVVNLVGLLVLLVWIPLRQKPGVGTICNVLVIGTAADVALWALPPIEGLALRIAFLAAAIVLNGAATAAYIGAGLGPGPRDGLTTGLVRITGWKVGWARTAIEVAVLGGGWLLGGVAGVGTLLYALANGPLMQFFMRWFEIAPEREVSPARSV
ncbi:MULTISPECIES: membrane protein YczE [unclassified Brevundimonas]|uniref:membrane protein YczE n=1 Tax=unclassified Brevundimonas TaxID=2622653 RepID=UPI003F91FDF5